MHATQRAFIYKAARAIATNNSTNANENAMLKALL